MPNKAELLLQLLVDLLGGLDDYEDDEDETEEDDEDEDEDEEGEPEQNTQFLKTQNDDEVVGTSGVKGYGSAWQ